MPHIPFGEHWTLIIKPSKRGKNPPHLKKYQEKMRRIAPLCAKKTAHLKGEKRVMALNYCILKEFEKEKNEEKSNNSH